MAKAQVLKSKEWVGFMGEGIQPLPPDNIGLREHCNVLKLDLIVVECQLLEGFLAF